MAFYGVPAQFRRVIKFGSPILNSTIMNVWHGDVYRGKSHSACNAVYQRLEVERAMWAHFVSGESLLQEVHTALKADKSAFAVMQKYFQCPYLVLDDFLATARQWVEPGVGRINELVRTRLDNHRPTLITTNLSYEEMERRKLEPRILSRIAAGSWIEFTEEPDPARLGKLWDAPKPIWMHEVDALYNACVAQERCYSVAGDYQVEALLDKLPREALREVAKFPAWMRDYLRAIMRDMREGA